MDIKFKKFTNSLQQVILYTGNPDLILLEKLSLGNGDIWHSSFEQGYKNTFKDIVYQAVVFFWFINDFDDLDQCISWRLNPKNFAVRESVWNSLGGFDNDFENDNIKALDFAFNALKNYGAIPYYVQSLFKINAKDDVTISNNDRYIFYRKNFKMDHSYYMLFRKGFWKLNEWKSLLYAKKHFNFRPLGASVPPRKLNTITGKPSVSYIIPTMMRQDFTITLLNDLVNQSYQPSQVVVVDATPDDNRDLSLYNNNEYPFEVSFNWQTTKGSCRARNEAIALCTGDYIIFGDDDIRIQSDFIENHIRILQTYDAGACNGLDIMADNPKQDLTDLERKLNAHKHKRSKVGAALTFNNANTCVKREYVNNIIGNDINYDGGYGEDSDFGLSLLKSGVTIIQNPFSVNLHLKPSSGGYRFWGNQSKILGKKRKKQPWELDSPVKNIRPVPSPTIMYQIHKHFTADQLKEYKIKYFILKLFKGKKRNLIFKIFKLPYMCLQFNRSVFYAQKLLKLGPRYK